LQKIILILLIGLSTAPRVYSYSIITEPDVFYSFFSSPMTTIEFGQLKDGTSYENIRYRIKPDTFKTAEPQCSIVGRGDLHFTGSDNSIPVRSDAFSDDWSFSAVDIKSPEVSCEAVIWFNQGISAGVAKMSVAAANGKSEPFALYTNKGFIGVVPDNPRETVFTFDNFSAVFSFETRFSRPPTQLSTTDSLMARSKSKDKPSKEGPSLNHPTAVLVAFDS